MVALALFLASVVVLAGWSLVLALAGRSSVPRRERLPVSAWRFADLWANAVRGITEVGSVGTSQPALRSRVRQ